MVAEAGERADPVAKATIRFITAYAARQGVAVASYLEAAGPALTVEQAGTAITGLITDPGHDRDAYLLTAAGLTAAPLSGGRMAVSRVRSEEK